MTGRTPSVPPLLDGYTYVELLGSGGFADVFKYTQQRPRRDVAVKVLLRGLGADAQRQFEAEANLMAMLSNHPSIVSIYAAGVAADGRPYLVMENCQPRHLGVRIKQRPLSVGRALEIGIQVAGAVETAHRLGILHRDIKPANILFTEFGRPALTDFGIGVAEGEAGAAAFSVAWAPPEQIANRPMGPTGDVYSLAATFWAMLVGRSPFDVPGDNSSLAITNRAKTMPPPPTGRPGVPASLELILRTAMAKDPEQRYGSALEFARALQGVQAELHESVTTIDVREDRSDDDFVDLTETGTRVTGFKLIEADALRTDTQSGWFDVSDSRGTRPTDLTGQGATGPSGVLQHGRGSRAAHEPLEFTGPQIPRVPDEDTFLVGGSTPVNAEAPAPRRKLLPILLVAAVALVVVGIVAAWQLSGRGGATDARTPTTSAKPLDPVGVVPSPAGLKGVATASGVQFSWTNPDPKKGDRFLYRPVLLAQDAQVESTTETSATLPAQSGRTCIEVVLVRDGGAYSEPAKACVP